MVQLILIPGVDILGWRTLAGAGTAFGTNFYHRLQKWETTHAQRKKHVINQTVKARPQGSELWDENKCSSFFTQVKKKKNWQCIEWSGEPP